MSENLDLVRSIFADWERGKFSTADWAHPEIEWVLVDGPDPGCWRGIGGMAEGFRSWLRAWEDLRIVLDEDRELDGERILVFQHNEGRGRTSGVELGQIGESAGRRANVFHLRDGRVHRLVTYYDRQRALADLGLAE
jgi:ketosteroid isomerase-like protein